MSLEVTGTRPLGLSKKKKLTRAIDKARDLGLRRSYEIVGSLRQSILIHQVSIFHGRSRRSLTRGTGVTTTVRMQPGCPLDRDFYSR